MAPAPGRIPRKNPSADPRRIGSVDALQSSRVGSSPVVGGAKFRRLVSLLEIEEHFGDAEEPHDDRNQPEAVLQRPDAEGESKSSADDVLTDRAAKQADGRHDERLHHRLAREIRQQRQAEDHEGEVFRGAEAQRDTGQEWRQERQGHDTQRSGDERPERRDPQCRAGPSLARHGVTVQTGDDGGRLARDVHEDGRRRAAVHGAVVDARQHDDGRDRGRRERGRQQQRDRRRRPEPGEDADQGADEHAGEAIEKVDGLQRDLESVEDAVKDLHAQNPNGPVGSCVLSHTWNSPYDASVPMAADTALNAQPRCSMRNRSRRKRNVTATNPSGSSITR